MKTKHLRIIREIQERIPKDLLNNLTKKELANPAAKKVIETALADPELPQKKRRRYQALMDAGYLDQMVEVIDPEVEKKIDEFMTKEIDLAVKLGRLPKEAPQLETLTKKGKQYARRQHARLKALFTGKDSDVADDQEDDSKDESEHSPRQDDGGVLHGSSSEAGEQGSSREVGSESSTA